MHVFRDKIGHVGQKRQRHECRHRDHGVHWAAATAVRDQAPHGPCGQHQQHDGHVQQRLGQPVKEIFRHIAVRVHNELSDGILVVVAHIRHGVIGSGDLHTRQAQSGFHAYFVEDTTQQGHAGALGGGRGQAPWSRLAIQRVEDEQHRHQSAGRSHEALIQPQRSDQAHRARQKSPAEPPHQPHRQHGQEERAHKNIGKIEIARIAEGQHGRGCKQRPHEHEGTFAPDLKQIGDQAQRRRNPGQGDQPTQPRHAHKPAQMRVNRL